MVRRGGGATGARHAVIERSPLEGLRLAANVRRAEKRRKLFVGKRLMFYRQCKAGCAIATRMKPSLALDAYREQIRRIVAANRGLNPRVFGSALHREDTENSDLDLLIDAAEGMTLFDMAAIAAAIEHLTHAKVDVRTPEDLSIKFRNQVIAEARPV